MKQQNSLRKILEKLPKIDLHCHLDGSARPETLFELAKKHGFKLPTTNLNEFKKFVQVPKSCRSLSDFLKTFDFFYDFLKFPDSVEIIAYQLCEDSAKENIRYLEVRFAPALQSTKNFKQEDVLKSALLGIKRATEKFNIHAYVIICLYRSLDEKTNKQALRLAEKYLNNGVVGIDLAGDESKYPIDLYKDLLKYAKKSGIPITIHAGESDGAESVKKAIEYGAKRIGHGIKAAIDKKILKILKENKIPLEICLTSNVQTQAVKNYKSHPFINLYNYGIPITLNTDDRGVSGIDLTHEYQTAIEEYNLKIEDIKKLILNGIEAAFASEDIKYKLKQEISEELKSIKL